jgi:hypothetical protein
MQRPQDADNFFDTMIAGPVASRYAERARAKPPAEPQSPTSDWEVTIH